MKRNIITQLALVLILLLQGAFPVVGMADKAAMAMPEHAMPSQCAHMDSMDKGSSAGDCCGPGADCCRIKTGNQSVAACARTMPPRLAVTGLLLMEKGLSAIAADGFDLARAPEAPPPFKISLYKTKNAFLI